MQKVILKGVQESEIQARLFEPKDKNDVTVIICPATGVKQSYYFNFSEHLAASGYTVLTFDYQGVGESRPNDLRGFKCSATDWCENNLARVIEYATSQLKPQKLLLIGHSIGGQFIGLCKASSNAHGIILVGSQIGYWRLWPLRLRPRMWFNWYVLIPSITFVFGYLPAKRFGIMEDLPKEAALEWATWCKSPDHFFDHKPDAEQSFASLNVPLVSFSFADDDYAPKIAVDRLLAKYSNCLVREKHLKPRDFGLKRIGHFGLFKKKNKELLWEGLVEEIEKMAMN